MSSCCLVDHGALLLLTCPFWVLFFFFILFYFIFFQVFAGNSMNMKLSSRGALLTDSQNRRSCFCNLLVAAALFSILFFIGSAFITFDYKEKVSTWEPAKPILQTTKQNLCKSQGKPLGSEPLPKGILSRTSNLEMQPLLGGPRLPKRKKVSTWEPAKSILQTTKQNLCKNQGKPSGSETLPKGILSRTSNLEMQLLWGGPRLPKRKGHKIPSKSLLAIAVGIKQMEVVNQIVKKFSSSDFIVMLFHYDGNVDQWGDLSWSDQALHVSAINQTKWWFAKRFLHPDIVAEYDYIFLWDEDLDVEHFNPRRYLSIVRREGLEISQPGLDTSKSQVHYQITARLRKGDVHRRVYKFTGGGGCYENSTGPPCTGWVEIMAPVFSRAAWRCAWHMIQNDLIHAWGLDTKLGYCAQGVRSKKVGVVDSEYIGHMGIPTLGGLNERKSSTETSSDSQATKSPPAVPSGQSTYKGRYAVRHRSYVELEIFKKRWQRAVAEDKCWTDPYPEQSKKVDR